MGESHAPARAGEPHVTVHRLRFNDTDRLGHVNNAVYSVMVEQGRTELFLAAGLPLESDAHALVIARLELDFMREMRWPGEVRIETEVAWVGARSLSLRTRLLFGGQPCARAVSVLAVMDLATRRAAPIPPGWAEALRPWTLADAWRRGWQGNRAWKTRGRQGQGAALDPLGP